MRNISFSLTTKQVRESVKLAAAGKPVLKDVTRRLNWLGVKVGDRLQACEKCMGRHHGEPLVRLAVIEVVGVRREKLRRLTDETAYGLLEVAREGFFFMPTQCFVRFFCKSHKGCTPETVITRIEFKYASVPLEPNMRIGDTVIVPKMSQRGRWWVKIIEISSDGKFFKVGTPNYAGAFGKPRWVGLSEIKTQKTDTNCTN